MVFFQKFSWHSYFFVAVEIPDKTKQSKSNGGIIAVAIQHSVARSGALLKTLVWRKPLSSLLLHVLKGYPEWCFRHICEKWHEWDRSGPSSEAQFQVSGWVGFNRPAGAGESIRVSSLWVKVLKSPWRTSWGTHLYVADSISSQRTVSTVLRYFSKGTIGWQFIFVIHQRWDHDRLLLLEGKNPQVQPVLANAVKLTEKSMEKTTCEFAMVTYREKCWKNADNAFCLLHQEPWLPRVDLKQVCGQLLSQRTMWLCPFMWGWVRFCRLVGCLSLSSRKLCWLFASQLPSLRLWLVLWLHAETFFFFCVG